jgi:phosphoglucomutase
MTDAKDAPAKVSPLAGKRATPAMLVDVPRLVTAYYTGVPDSSVQEQRVAFGTSGHRGSAFECTFNEWHVLSISQAICDYRKRQGIAGPLFLGIDTHALSVPACASALEVLAANGVEVMLADKDEYTPTPVISHAILAYNRGRDAGLADGIVITPSHNPPDDGGFKYNPPNGGPADNHVTGWIEARANAFLESGLQGVKRISFEQAQRAGTTHRRDFLNAYVSDLGSVLDMDAIRGANISMGVDPLGGAGVHYWGPIAERYGLNLTVVNEVVDPTFRFMTVDWDGQIRMDPSSSYAMQSLIGLKDRFDIAFACDTDHDRHGIVTRSAGLLPPNHYLSVAILYLFQHRTKWAKDAAVGKTIVSSQMIDRVTAKLDRKLYEVPVGFKWFVDGLLDGSLALAGKRVREYLLSVWMAASGPQIKTALSPLCCRRRLPLAWAAIPGKSIVSSRASSANLFTIVLRRQLLRSKSKCWRNSHHSRYCLRSLLVKKLRASSPRLLATAHPSAV